MGACRSDDYIVYTEQEQTGGKTEAVGDIVGLYVLNEGNMGANKCTIDYLDLASGQYNRNIYSERNPNQVKELGDVGNDIKIYGSRMWIVVNCSNKVEVVEASSCKRIGQVDIANCRNLAFNGGYAYVSSYAGPVETGGKAQLGKVYKVDTLSLARVDSVVVGYQPEEIAIVGGKLYVTNSGGYRQTGDYDRTVSEIDLSSFKEMRKIDVAINPHRCRADKYGQLWVSSRGTYEEPIMPSRLYWLANDGNGQMAKHGELDIMVTDMDIVGDTLYYIGVDANSTSNFTSGMVDVRTHEIISKSLSSASEYSAIQVPYGIKVNPIGKDFYLMDAKDYVSSGSLLHFLADGSFDWQVRTGDIPGHAAFLHSKATADDSPTQPDEPKTYSKYIAGVDEYVPAPGQFVNTLPQYEEGDDAAAMAQKCTERISGDNGRLVSLGGYGGYITFHFDHPIANVEGERDFAVYGNAYDGNSEPGIVMVSRDDNGNGLPDDQWYELRGSADEDSIGKVTYGYEITYKYAAMDNIPWTDNQGSSGYVYRNAFHQQEYYPQWLTSSDLTFRGTRLPDNGVDTSGQGNHWVLSSFSWGYVDNKSNSDLDGCSFDISWAVDSDRNSVNLDHVDFIRVYNAMNQTCGWIGETSTEISGAEDLHL